jgi:hypothetical protein
MHSANLASRTLLLRRSPFRFPNTENLVIYVEFVLLRARDVNPQAIQLHAAPLTGRPKFGRFLLFVARHDNFVVLLMGSFRDIDGDTIRGRKLARRSLLSASIDIYRSEGGDTKVTRLIECSCSITSSRLNVRNDPPRNTYRFVREKVSGWIQGIDSTRRT